MAEIDTSQASAALNPAQGLSQELQDYLSRPLPKPPVEPKGIGPEDIKKAYDAQAADITQIAQQQNKVDAATAEQMRGIQQKYEGQYQQAPEFKPTPESKQDLLALFGMLGAMGAMAGGKSYGSALGAMNAMGGMLNGYAQGRQDLFNREKSQFDEHLKSVQMHNQQISQAFDRAIKMAPYNLSQSTNKLIQELKSNQADMLAAQVQRDGTIKASESWNQLNSKYEAELNKRLELLTKMNKSISGSALVPVVGPDGNTIMVTRDQASQAALAGNPYKAGSRYMQPEQMAYRQWITPGGQGGKIIYSVNTVAQHLNQLEELSEALNNKDYPLINKIANRYSAAVGEDPVTNFQAAKQAVASEIVRVITGAGGALADRQEAEGILNEAKSPAQLKGAIEKIKGLIGGRINSASIQYKSGTKRDDFKELLSADAIKAFGKYADSGQSSGATPVPPEVSVSGW
jgi:hypothetical protein